MPKPRVYVETTIPSFYHEKRTAPALQAMRRWTREWWEVAPERYELVTSLAAVKELLDGPNAWQMEWLAFFRDLPFLEIVPAVEEIAETYVRHKLMPADPYGDALHLALASYYKCEFLATWNYQHLANANKFAHIRRINSMLGLSVPDIVTPPELLGRQS